MKGESVRIAFVTMQFPVPTETFASNDVKALQELGVAVEVFALRPAHPEGRLMLEERGLDRLSVLHNGIGLTIEGMRYAFGRPKLFLETLTWLVSCTWLKPIQLFRSLGVLPAAAAILKRLSSNPPDFVHIAWGHYPAIVGFLVQRALPDCATSISLAAYDLTLEFRGSIEVARNADFVRTLAQYNVPHLRRFTGVASERIQVVYDGIDVQRIQGLVKGREKVPFRIAVASRLTAEKRVDDAIRIFAELRRRFPSATLVVMGEGEARRQLQSLCRRLEVADAVDFLGHVPQQRVLEELAMAEVALLTSVKESERLPNAVKEGMACGCVVVASATPGIHELIEPGETGFVYPQGDVAAAAEAIEAVFSRRLDVEAITTKARADVERRYDLSHTAQQYVELWRGELERRRRSTSTSSDRERDRQPEPEQLRAAGTR